MSKHVSPNEVGTGRTWAAAAPTILLKADKSRVTIFRCRQHQEHIIFIAVDRWTRVAAEGAPTVISAPLPCQGGSRISEKSSLIRHVSRSSPHPPPHYVDTNGIDIALSAT